MDENTVRALDYLESIGLTRAMAMSVALKIYANWMRSGAGYGISEGAHGYGKPMPPKYPSNRPIVTYPRIEQPKHEAPFVPVSDIPPVIPAGSAFKDAALAESEDKEHDPEDIAYVPDRQ